MQLYASYAKKLCKSWFWTNKLHASSANMDDTKCVLDIPLIIIDFTD